MTTGLLMAAGASRRFGRRDKLLAPVQGIPLVTHAAQALRDAMLDVRIAVVASGSVGALVADFDAVEIVPASNTFSDNLKAGLRLALLRNPSTPAVLIALADMPNVAPSDIDAVVAACSDERPSSAYDGVRRAPPACFPARWFARLLTLSGDRGAGALLHEATLVSVAPQTLSDIDTAADLNEISRTPSCSRHPPFASSKDI